MVQGNSRCHEFETPDVETDLNLRWEFGCYSFPIKRGKNICINNIQPISVLSSMKFFNEKKFGDFKRQHFLPVLIRT